MEFKNLLVQEMEKVMSDLLNTEVMYQDEDAHAVYFDGADGEREYKVVTDDDSYSLNERKAGIEDWDMRYDIDVNEDMIASVI